MSTRSSRSGYLWDAAWCFFEEGDPAAERWVQEKARAVLDGQASTVAAAIRRKATRLGLEQAKRKNADTCADYLAKRAYLDYPTALTNGWPIATGVIEGACRHLIKDRMDITGARWGLESAEAALKLRALRSNGDFDEYWRYHRNGVSISVRWCGYGPAVPTADIGHPGSYAVFVAWFPDEAACRDYLEWLRWPEGFRCPRCPNRAGWQLDRGRWECSLCGHQATVTAGTIFARTRVPLRLWFEAAWLMTSQKHGISALGVQRALGLGSYQTAWAMLHRFRVAMVRPGRERLSGHIEVDEAYVGGVEEGVAGRETQTKSIVAIAVEIRNLKGFGRVRMQSVPDVSQESLIDFVTGAVESGATVHTDGWPAYLALPKHGYEHERTVMSAQPDPAHVVMPGVHRIASLLKRWLLGTHQGSASPEHLDAYLNEFTFRFNRRRSRRRGLLCYRLLQQAILAEPVTYRQLVANPQPRERPQPLHLRRRGRAPALHTADRPWRRG